MGKSSRRKRERREDRAEWVADRLVSAFQAAARSADGRGDPTDDEPVAWLFDGKETLEMLPDGTIQPSQWRAL